MALGPRKKGKTAVRRVPLNLKVPPALRKSMEKAADRSGRSLGAEVEFRAQEYETLRSFVDYLLSNSADLDIVLGMGTLRKGADEVTPIPGPSGRPLTRAVVTATCMSKLFAEVAKHAAKTLANDTATLMADKWTQQIQTGEIKLKDGLSVEGVAADNSETWAEISSLMVDAIKHSGNLMASRVGATFATSIWDVCFNKDDPFHSSNIDLPPSYLPPSIIEKARLTFMAKLKKSSALRAAVRRQMSEERHPGMSEEEAIDMACDELLQPFDTKLSEAVPDAKAN